MRAAARRDLGLATTGVAGPDPQDGHPPGEVYLALAGPGTAPRVARRWTLTGDRGDGAARRPCAAALALLACTRSTGRERMQGDYSVTLD